MRSVHALFQHTLERFTWNTLLLRIPGSGYHSHLHHQTGSLPLTKWCGMSNKTKSTPVMRATRANNIDRMASLSGQVKLNPRQTTITSADIYNHEYRSYYVRLFMASERICTLVADMMHTRALEATSKQRTYVRIISNWWFVGLRARISMIDWLFEYSQSAPLNTHFQEQASFRFYPIDHYTLLYADRLYIENNVKQASNEGYLVIYILLSPDIWHHDALLS